MFFRAKTAILIAVFLLFFLGGCYTKLKHPAPVIIPEEAEVIGVDDQLWDFSYGWYWSDWYRYSMHYGYYCTPWWYDCPWCLQNDLYSQDGEIAFKPSGKIVRRDDSYTPQEGFHYLPPEDLTSQQLEVYQQQYPQSLNQSQSGASKSKNEIKHRDNSFKIKRRGR